MSFANDDKRRIELRRKLGDHHIERIQADQDRAMRALAACNDILWRVRMLRHSAGRLA